MMTSLPWMRYVALGDSLTEGVGDPIADGSLRGWADMLAGALKRSNPDLDYRNLARRSLTAAQVRQSQLEPALAVAPDLASVAVGMNDVLAPSFDKNSFERDLVSLVHPLIESGATVLVGTLPEDLPLLRLMRGKAAATRSRLKTVGAVVGAVCGDLGALVVDAPEEWSYGIAECSVDGCHPNARGHAHIARIALGVLCAHASVVPAELPASHGGWAKGAARQLRWLVTEGYLGHVVDPRRFLWRTKTRAESPRRSSPKKA